MSRATLALLIFLAGFTALTQPGLCPCWLIAEAGKFHPHPDGHPERPHDHAYLSDLFHAETAPVVPPFIAPASAVITLLALGGLWRRVGHPVASVANWTSPPNTPPPRRLALR